MTLRIAFDYSARAAIAAAARALGPDATVEDLDRLIAGPAGGPVDLLIRTGAEKRLSDFLLWECAYAELSFFEGMWPSFGSDDLAAAIADFRRRERRFGALSNDGEDLSGRPSVRRHEDHALLLCLVAAGILSGCVRASPRPTDLFRHIDGPWYLEYTADE